MLKMKFGEEEWHYSTNNEWTPLHSASLREVHIVKCLIEEGADIYSIWAFESLKNKMIVFALINNFNDPFYQIIRNPNEIEKSRMNILIENGMI